MLDGRSDYAAIRGPRVSLSCVVVVCSSASRAGLLGALVGAGDSH